MPYNPFVQVSDQDAVVAALTENMLESGTYLIPIYSSVEEDDVEWTRRHKEGPIAMIFFRREDTSPMSTMLPGFLHMFFSVVLMALLLRIVLPALPGSGKRVAFVAFVGFVVTFWITVAMPIWRNQPLGFHLYSFSTTWSAGLWLDSCWRSLSDPRPGWLRRLQSRCVG